MKNLKIKEIKKYPYRYIPFCNPGNCNGTCSGTSLKGNTCVPVPVIERDDLGYCY